MIPHPLFNSYELLPEGVVIKSSALVLVLDTNNKVYKTPVSNLLASTSSSLGDPGANGIIKRTSLNTTAVAIAGTDYELPITILPINKGGTGTATPNLIQGTNIIITGIWPNQTITSTSGITIANVANYSALPDPTTVSGLYYWVSSPQGTSWLPGTLGGTYYPDGLYRSNGTTWEYMDIPYQASQSEVNTEVINDKFVTPLTLGVWWSQKPIPTIVQTALNAKYDASNPSNFITSATATSTYQPLDGDLTAIAALNTIGFAKRTGVNTWTIDTSTYEVPLTFSTGLNRVGNTITSTITQYTDTLARASLSFTAGSGDYNSSTGLITIPTNTNQLTNGSGFITANQTITLNGDVTGAGTTTIATTIANDAVTTVKIINGAVTFTKQANISTNKLLGRGTAGSGIIEEITLGTNLSLSGTTLNATGGGGATIVEVEVDLGTIPVRGKKINVTVSGLLSTNKVQTWLSGNQATGKGTGELEMDAISLGAKANNGNFTLYVASATKIKGKYKIYYTYQ